MEEIITTREVLRFFAPGYRRKRMLTRWNFIYDSYHSGQSVEAIAEHCGLHKTTIVQLLKRAAQERIKSGQLVWPLAPDGRRICDIDSPMPRDGRPWEYEHRRAYHLKNVNSTERKDVGYCPVCRKGGCIFGGKTLMEVFSSSQA